MTPQPATARAAPGIWPSGTGCCWSDAADRLARLAARPALAGAESLLFQARLAWRDGEADRARAVVSEALTELPGHQELHTLAAESGAALPARVLGAAGRFSC
ncbi:hypothetical protein [Streptomyces sp. NPDC050263]|uniref:hypothetical protein n=1 Tax=Streptomyces sp. NPDC050263 TaxID=3155037 RepID=UPI003418A063